MSKNTLIYALLGLSWACSTQPASHVESIQSNGNPPSQARSFITNLPLGATLHSFLTDNGLTAEPCFQWVHYEDDSTALELSSSSCPPQNALAPKEAVVARLTIVGGRTGALYSPESGAVIGSLIDTGGSDSYEWTGIRSLCTGSYDNACTLLVQDGALTGISYPPPPPPPPPPVGTIPAVGAYVTVVRPAALQAGTTVAGHLDVGGRYKVLAVQGQWISLQDSSGKAEPGWVDVNNLQILN